MSLLMAIIIGVLVGAGVTEFIDKSLDLLFINSLLGISGAIIGIAIYFFAGGIGFTSFFSPAGALSAAIGAMVLVMLFSLVHKVKPKEVVHENTDTDDHAKENIEEDE